MELNHLQVFFEVAKNGSFTEAAQKLNISQSALSRSVALLEESENVVLFERSKRGLKLTDVGEEVFRNCQEMFQVLNKISEVCRGRRETIEGPLKFATTDHVTNHLLLMPLQNFRSEFPLVIPSIFNATYSEIIEHLRTTEIEFGLTFTKPVAPQIDYQTIGAEIVMALVVHADVWRENKAATQAATLDRVLSKVGYISSIGSSTQTKPSQLLIELFGKLPRIGFEANSQETQKRVCLSRGGVAYLARFMVEQEIKSGTLHEITLRVPHVFSLYVATRKGRVLSNGAKLFLERLNLALT